MKLGLIAGNGRLPLLVAQAAQAQGMEVHAVGHQEETDPALERHVASLRWVRVGQVDGILRALRRQGVTRAVMAGGIGRVRALTQARPDLGGLRVLAGLRSLRDDTLLRGIAAYFERQGVAIVSVTQVTPELLAPVGHLAGPRLGDAEARDVALGLEVCELLGRADVGQTVVLKGGNVLALEAVEGTDEAIRRGGKYGGGPGAVVVKLCKRGQDERFDLPAVGPRTLAVMAEVGARVLALEAGRSLLLDGPALFSLAEQSGITLVGVLRPQGGA